MGARIIRILTALILAAFLSFNVYAAARTYSVSGILRDYPDSEVSFSDTYGAEHRQIKTGRTDSKGFFSFTLTGDDHAGIYRLGFGKEQRIDIIFNHEDVHLETGHELSYNNIKFTKSRENILFQGYMEKEKGIEQKHKALLQAGVSYPRNDPFYDVLRDQIARVEKEKADHYKAFTRSAADTFAGKIVTWMQVETPDLDLPESERKDFVNRNIFKNIDFSDPDIVYTGVIPARIKEFFMINQDSRNISRQEYEGQLIKLIDEVFVYARESVEVRRLIVDFLIRLFKDSGLEKVYAHVADNYFEDEYCETGGDEAEKIRRRSEAFKRLAIGRKAPDIVLPGTGAPQKISDHAFRYAVVIFWETGCPFCREFLKGLKSLDEKLSSGGIRIFSISLDEKREELEEYLGRENFSWPTYSDFTGMKGSAVQDCFIYATPTVFILDDKLEILAKPAGFPEFELELKKVLP